LKIISVVGTRPEFIQSAPVSRALRRKHQEILVHTGQHYDYLMSQAFFDDLGIPAPDYNLEVGSGSHGYQTGQMLIRMEKMLRKEQPDLVVVRGDTNSTLVGALAAAKLHIPVAHIEAGERSFDRRMPEEINRLLADRLADIHFCVSHTSVQHLAAEGITARVYQVGDVMFDVTLQSLAVARRRSDIRQCLKLTPHKYILVTVHRAANTDDPKRLGEIVEALNNINERIVFPVHPRTQEALGRLGAQFAPHVQVIEPVGYFDMLILEEGARLIMTDSGGVQREAYFLATPCLTLRQETEWVETVEAGWNRLVGTDPSKIIDAWRTFEPPLERPAIFGDGHASQHIVAILESEPIVFGR
jgi:UDP-GlcNAc3NAcA epimerase